MTRPNTVEDFWARVAVAGPEDCWPWTGGLSPKGYGCFKLAGVSWRANRLSLYLSTGVEPEKALHTCDNPSCCNPAHLYDGTPAQNIADMDARGRRRVLQGSAHPRAKLTEQQADDIRASSLPGIELAAAYGVDPRTISSVRHGITWHHQEQER